MKRRILPVLLFSIRFVLIASVCFFLWWWAVLPHYAWLLGQVSGAMINLFADEKIVGLGIDADPESVLRVDISLVFRLADRERVFPVGDLVNSPITFIALVLATWSLKLRRMALILVGGALFFFVGQVLYVTAFYLFTDELNEYREFRTAIGQFWLTLPFVMWIVLAYGDRLKSIFQDEPHQGS